MRYPKTLLSFERLHECFVLDDDGGLTWRRRPRHHFATDSLWKTQNTRDAGRPAGTADAKGYLRVRFDGKLHLCHRIVWKMAHNEEPPAEIDHIDQDRSNNAPSNLRSASRSLNCINKGIRSDNQSGIKGVRARGNRWSARICVSGQSVHLGTFDTPEAAAAAHMMAALEHYGIDGIEPANRSAFEHLVCDLAAKDVRAGKREIPGFTIIEEKKAV